MHRLACLVAVALGLAVVAGAQESRGTIQGSVKDPQGAAVAGAMVTVINTDTNSTATLKASEAGRVSCASGVTNATAAGCLEDTNFGNNVPNPFYIGNLSPLQSSNPALYSALASQGFFTSTTITKASLLRPYPTAYFFQPTPIGHERETEFDLALNHRFSRGLVANFGYTYFDSRFANASCSRGIRSMLPTRRRPSGSRTTSTPTALPRRGSTTCRSARAARGCTTSMPRCSPTGGPSPELTCGRWAL